MSSRDDKIEYLESERAKIWVKILALEELVSKKTSDYEEAAKLSSENASGYEKTSGEATESILASLGEATTKLNTLKATYNSLEQIHTDIKSISETAKQNGDLIQALYDSINTKSEVLQSQILEIEKLVDNKPVLDEKLAKLQVIFTQGDDYDTRLKVLFGTITDRKKEIDELYYSIIGYTGKDASGGETRIEGLKDQLQNSYNEIQIKLEGLEKSLNLLEKNTAIQFDEFMTTKQLLFDSSFKTWKEEHEAITKKLEELLPNALTAGLSYAYSEKKQAEEKESKGFSSNFKIAIFGLVLVSLIPFGFSVKSLLDKVALEDVIERIPRLVLAILPLYIPVLWLAYSYNRKMNLSKRLIEEYSHKEVLSKTFEGLSRQINSIEDKETSSDLRTRLLFNILEVNSENPGKLISDYNKSDHPLMDALDKSIKLTNAMTKLAKIPGFSKLASTLEKKAEDVLKKESEKADAGLSAVSPPTPVA